MKVKFLTAAAATAVAGFSGTAAMADCGEVTITEMNWASSAVITAVSKFVMEQGYGCNVVTVPSSTVPALVSVAETGAPQIVTELWINGAPAYQELQDAGKIETVADVLSDGGVEAWWVPQYMVDANPELATIEGILANKDLLGGRFHNCPDGWACKNTNATLAKNFGLEEAGYEIFQHGSGETLATSIGAAFENEEPWLGYYWAPTAILGKYPMVEVDMGVEYNEEVFLCAANAECETDGVSSWPVGPVKTIVTTDFSANHPELAEFMGNVSFTNRQMGEVLAWKDANSASNEEAAVYFLTNYQDVWADWLNDAAKEKLAPLLK